MLIAEPIGHSCPYGFDEHLIEWGSGTNLLRTDRFAQPTALKSGDILASGHEIAQPCRGYNSSVVIPMVIQHPYHPMAHEWMNTAPRLPVALYLPGESQFDIEDVVGGKLRTNRWAQPLALREDDLLPTGDRVIAAPQFVHGHDIKVMLTGGWTGHEIYIHYYLPIALLTEDDGAPEEIWKKAREWKPNPSRQ